MSIYLSSNGRWEGAALKYCQEAESFVNPKIIERHRLGTTDDGRTKLTWRLCDEQESNVTQFIVLEGLSCDFMLGTKCCDEKFNRDESSPDDEEVESAPGSSNSYEEPPQSPLPHLNSPIDPTSPEMANLIRMAAHINLETAAMLTCGQQYRDVANGDRRLYQPPGRLPLGEVQSVPSATHSSSGRDRHSKKRVSTASSMGTGSTNRHATQR